MHNERTSHLLLMLVLFSLAISMAHGAGWSPLLVAMPLFLTVFGGITYQLIIGGLSFPAASAILPPTSPATTMHGEQMSKRVLFAVLLLTLSVTGHCAAAQPMIELTIGGKTQSFSQGALLARPDAAE